MWRRLLRFIGITIVLEAGILWPVSGARVVVHFDETLQLWDGFGVNYVETSQTRDYEKWPQDYGGFSTLTEKQRHEILDLIFGEDGLKPGIVKMFIDPFHEGTGKSGNDNDDAMKIDLSGYTHERTTKWMRYRRISGGRNGRI